MRKGKSVLSRIVRKDIADRAECERVLRKKWRGATYQANLRAILATIRAANNGADEVLLNARTDDGTALFNVPRVVMFWHDIAMNMNPLFGIMPPAKRRKKRSR